MYRKEVSKLISLNIDQLIIDQLNDLYTGARYPVDIGLLPTGKPTVEEARQFFVQAKEVLSQSKICLSE